MFKYKSQLRWLACLLYDVCLIIAARHLNAKYLYFIFHFDSFSSDGGKFFIQIDLHSEAVCVCVCFINIATSSTLVWELGRKSLSKQNRLHVFNFAQHFASSD